MTPAERNLLIRISTIVQGRLLGNSHLWNEVGKLIKEVRDEEESRAPDFGKSCHTCGRVVDGSCGIEEHCTRYDRWKQK